MADNENQSVDTPEQPETTTMPQTRPMTARSDDHDNVSSGNTVSDRPASDKPFGRVEKPSVPPSIKPLTPSASSSTSESSA